MIEEGTPPTSPGDDLETGDTSSVQTTAEPADEDLVIDDLLVEEVSIDGMCGVY